MTDETMLNVAAMPLTFEAAREEAFRMRVAEAGATGWSPRMRRRFDYFTPDESYEGVMMTLVGPDTAWLDVGCGHQIFPSNPALARLLADRCRLLVGLDPSDNIDRNTFVHERAKCMLEDYVTDHRFDLISLRMVAEHVTDPASAVAALARLCRPGGRVVVYTVSKWSPASMAAALTPMAVHHTAKRLLWETAPEDTFPTAYRMNTRTTLKRQFEAAGFAEERFLRLADCRSFARWPLTQQAELMVWRGLTALGIPYPEACLIGVYRRDADGGA
ncbi:MAG: class I SAM-dependent methyltransferase [Acetobacteraceae bacterium]|nr:class I SAM-dependent methyltransferase [Acetobacteraceae bacterium]